MSEHLGSELVELSPDRVQRAGPQARLPLLVRPGLARPDGRHQGRGLARLGPARPAAARLHLAAGLHQPGPPAPPHRVRDPGAGGVPVHGRSAARQRRALRGRPADREPHARRPRQGVLHQRRSRRQRARDPDGTAAHRADQGALDLPLLPRRHPPRGQRHRRPEALGQRPRRGRHGALLRAVPLPQRLPRDHRGRGVRARAGAPGRRDRARGSRRRSPRSCSRPSPARPAS